MTINDIFEILNTLSSQTDKKSEMKIYSCFIDTLTALKNKDLTDNQLQLIEEKLTALDLKATTENRKKYINKKHSEFKGFLKNSFSFITEKYYTEVWMIYGMIFGTGLGISIGTAINPVIGTSIGLSIGTGIGMVLGMALGATKDAEAKKQGRVLTKTCNNKI
jgi:hypothetical protein